MVYINNIVAYQVELFYCFIFNTNDNTSIVQALHLETQYLAVLSQRKVKDHQIHI